MRNIARLKIGRLAVIALALFCCTAAFGQQTVSQKIVRFINPVAPDSISVSAPAWVTTTEYLTFAPAFAATDPTQAVQQYQWETSTNGGSSWGSILTGPTLTVSFTSGTLQVRCRAANPQWTTVAVSIWVNSANTSYAAAYHAPVAVDGFAINLTWISSTEWVGWIANFASVVATGVIERCQWQVSTDSGSTFKGYDGTSATWWVTDGNMFLRSFTSGNLMGRCRTVDPLGNVSIWVNSSDTAWQANPITNLTPTDITQNWHRRWQCTFYEPTSTGIDSGFAIEAPAGVSNNSLTWTPKRATLYCATPAAGATTLQIIKSTVGNAAFGSGTNLLSSSLTESGTSAYQTKTTSMSSTVVSGDYVAANWTAIAGTSCWVCIEFEAGTE